ncbi:chaperone DnaJ-domain superfamily protein isoform X2 [Wolffia australiana]
MGLHFNLGFELGQRKTSSFLKKNEFFLPPNIKDAVFAMGEEFLGQTAYEVLGVSETSSFSEIKAAFRKLAKETHPDVIQSCEPSVAGRRFLQILAAYEILSDSGRRAVYDSFLVSQRQILEDQAGFADPYSYTVRYSSSVPVLQRTDVAEWLQWYRHAVHEIVTQKEIASGTGYWGELESELYSAIRAAYYGPGIDSAALLPDCFEAEERSVEQTPEVLHLVSGRNLLGIVYIADGAPRLSQGDVGKLKASSLTSFQSSHFNGDINRRIVTSADRREFHDDQVPDAFRDLEVHISGRLIATATRDPPGGVEDRINVFLCNFGEKVHMRGEYAAGVMPSTNAESNNLLGTIRGLGTTSEEASCDVYDKNGSRTHVIMIHRTLLVKHMHWYTIGDEVASCECRCSRARLPPSRFWLFEPRCYMHDIGGWYVETFGRDRKGRTIPLQREWDGSMKTNKRLHPAMYFAALAYKTLDLEFAKRQKRPVRDIVGTTVSSLVHWCRRLL